MFKNEEAIKDRVLSREKHLKTYQRIESIIAKLTPGFARFFPGTVPPDKIPLLVIIDDDQDNAFIPNDVYSSDRPYAVYMHKGILKYSNEALTSIIAHELSHFFLQYNEYNTDYPAAKFYYGQPNDVHIGPEITRDEKLDQLGSRWLQFADVVGPFSHEFLGRLPIGAGENELGRIARSLIERNSTKPACEKVISSYSKVEKLLKPYIAPDQFFLKPIPTSKSQRISQLANQIESELKACNGEYRTTLEDFYANHYGISIYDARKILYLSEPATIELQRQEEEFFERLDAAEAILAIARWARAEMREIEKQIDLKTLRVYTHEDHADEISIYVIYRMGLNPLNINVYLKTAEPHAKPNQTIPNQIYHGVLDDDHHEPKWRIKRNEKFVAYLKTMSPTQLDNLFK